jgi:C-terminal processing protease CtpA/Prc
VNRSRFGALAWLIMLALTASAVPRPAAASEDPPSAQVDLAALAKQVQEVTDAVLDHHIDPPPRQQMILDGIKAVYEAAGLPIPAGLGRRVSALTRPEQFDALLREVWPRSPAKGVSPEGLQSAMVEGLLGSVPGRASMMSAKEARVAEQLDGNRYVGIHIAIGFDDEKKRPLIQDVFEGGPAQLAGAVKGDLFEEIDGVDTLGMDLRAAVDRLRGEAGTDVVVKVRHPQSKEVRTLKMTRGILPRQTIKGLRQRTNKDWDVLF